MINLLEFDHMVDGQGLQGKVGGGGLVEAQGDRGEGTWIKVCCLHNISYVAAYAISTTILIKRKIPDQT